MPDTVTVLVNGRRVVVGDGSMVAAAVMKAAVPFRRSVSGQPRGALCGMGVCFECRVTIDGQPHSRSCQVRCREGMEVRTDA